MTQSIIGPNAALRYLKAYNAHIDYWREVNPAYLLAYVDKGEHKIFIQNYAAAFPDSMVVARIQHDLDGGFHLKPSGANDTRHYVASPENYYKDCGFLGRINNVILNVLNEPNGYADDATIDRLVSWLLEYIPLAVNGKSKTCLINWGDRQPRIIGGMMDGRFGGILKLVALYPELFYIGMHLYGPDDITMHLESYIKLCEALEIKPLRVIATEFGFDKTNGNESGYKSRGVGGGAYAAWQISQVQHDLAPYIKSGVLVGLNVFQEGNSGGWDSFDIENDSDYKKELKRAALAGEIQPMTTATPKPTPTPETKPDYPLYLFNTGDLYTLQTSDGARTNVRSTPVVAVDNKVGNAIEDKTIVKLIAFKQVAIDYWYQIETATDPIQRGWISGRGGAISFTLLPTQPAPTPTPPQSAPFLEVSSELAARLASNARALSAACLQKAEGYKQAAETETLLAQEYLAEAQTWDDIAKQTTRAA